MGVRAVGIVLTDEERKQLKSSASSRRSEHHVVFRSKIILLAEEGLSNEEIAERLGTRRPTVSQWRKRFAEFRLDGLKDQPRPGAKRVYGEETDKRILEQLDKPVPAGFGVWSAPLISKALGDVSDQQVWRVLRRHHIKLRPSKSWCLSQDPDFVAKAADIVGLYVDPPEGAVVISFDEKPTIQALERAQGYLKYANGKTLTGHSHNYKRHGTTHLFAALNVATGQIQTGHYKRKRRVEFLDFMNRVIKENPDKELHVILDNLSTHKPKHDRWLARNKRVHFHYTPTSASWLNQVEVWFSIFEKRSLYGASFTSVEQLREHIDAFVVAHNKEAKPINWTKTDVRPKRFAPVSGNQ